MLFAVLWCADEHLDQIIVQAVEELALEGPLKLRIVEIARMQVVVVGVDHGLGKARTQDNLDAVALRPRTERHQRMLIQLELIEDAGQWVRTHSGILNALPTRITNICAKMTPHERSTGDFLKARNFFSHPIG